MLLIKFTKLREKKVIIMKIMLTDFKFLNGLGSNYNVSAMQVSWAIVMKVEKT